MREVVDAMELSDAKTLTAGARYLDAESYLRSALTNGGDRTAARRDLARLYEVWARLEYEKRDFAATLPLLKRALQCSDWDEDKRFRAQQLLLNLYRRLGREAEERDALKDLEDRFAAVNDPYIRNQIHNEREITEKRLVLTSYPNRLTVRLTNQCNILCVTCVMPLDKPWYVPDRVFDEIMTMTPYLSDLQWQGGEPMVFPQKKFKGLIERAGQNRHLSQNIITNGLLIDKPWAECLVRNRVHTRISIDGADKETFERIRHGGKWESLLASIANFNEERARQGGWVRLELHMVVMRSNYHQLEAMVEFAREHRFDIIDFSHIVIGANDPTEDIFERGTRETWTLLQDQRRRAREKAARYGIRLGDALPNPPAGILDEPASDALERAARAVAARAQEAAPPPDPEREGERRPARGASGGIDPFFCLSPWKQIIIREDGHLITNWHCINDGRHMHIGHCEREPLMTAWNSKFMQLLRRRISSCSQEGLCTKFCLSGALFDTWRDHIEWI